MNTVYNIPNEFAFATTSSQPANIMPTYAVNKNIVPFVAGTTALSVPTTWTLLASLPMNNAIELHSILVIFDSSALANGVKFFIQYGNYSAGTEANPLGAIVPLSISFDYAHYPIIKQGEYINLYAIAQATGSYIQIIVNGELI